VQGKVGRFSDDRDAPSKQSTWRKGNCTDDLVFLGERRPGTIATSNDTYRAESQSEQFARFASPWPNYRIPDIARAYERGRLLSRDSSAAPAKEKSCLSAAAELFR
jgi:hypothetical protein